ncbi:hypothetical protein ACU4GR_23410 [Methylobacterium oryzae CBMB20]
MPAALAEAAAGAASGRCPRGLRYRRAGDPLLDTHLQAVELLRDPSTCAITGFRSGAPCWSRPASRSAPWRRAGRAWTSRDADRPDAHAGGQRRAIRALQASAPAEATAHFAIETDGSFLLDSALIEARPR